MSDRERGQRLTVELADRIGVTTFAEVCCDLLGGAPDSGTWTSCER